jgi:uncharacterized protein (DUF433 family)
MLADVPEPKVRKDIEAGLLRGRIVSEGHRLWFRWVDVFLLAGVYRSTLLSGKLRRRAWQKLDSLNLAAWHAENYASNFCTHADVFSKYVMEDFASGLEIDDYVVIDFKKVIADLSPRVDLYYDGLARIEERSAILDGKPIFKGSRLSVFHVGKMYERGESLANILEDYPYLSDNDVRFAHMYYLAHPAVGRPRDSVEDLEDVDSAFAG